MDHDACSVSEDAQHQHWMKLIAAVRNLEAARVWFEYKHARNAQPDVVAEAGRSETERHVTSEPQTSSRQPTQSPGLGDTLR